MIFKRGLVLLVFLLFIKISLAQESNQCLLVNENNVDEAASRIWSTFSSLGLEAALSAVDSLKPGDNGYLFKEELKDALRRKASLKSCIDDYSLKEKDDCWDQDALCIDNGCVKFEEIEWANPNRSESIVKLKSSNLLERMDGALELIFINENEKYLIAPILIKTFETEENENVKYALIYPISYNALSHSKTVPLLIKVLKEEKDQGLVYKASEVLFNHFSEHDLVKENIDFILSKVFSHLPASSTPIKDLEIMQKSSLFRKIYYYQFFEGFSDAQKHSLSFATYRYLIKRYQYSDLNEVNILTTIVNIFDKRNKFRDRVVLGSDTYLIVFTHSDPIMENSQVIDFAKKRGVKNIYYKRSDLYSSQSKYLKGPEDKQEIIDAIKSSKDRGKTTIWINAHGLPDYICLGDGSNPSTATMCEGFTYDEFAKILIERGNLQEVILIIDSCFSYDFAENLLENLEEKSAVFYPTIITETNKGRYGKASVYRIGPLVYYTKSFFLHFLEQLNLNDESPLLGKHIFEAEEYGYQFQDSAVFFSENKGGISEEIALNSLHHACPFCIGDSCPIPS